MKQIDFDLKRSAIMRAVPRANSKPEIAVRKVLHGLGLRFRLHRRELPGTPDIVLARHRTVVFVHGCFWHRHRGCRRASMPKTAREFWRDKFNRNVTRDRQAQVELKKLGWKSIVIWECQTKREDALEALVAKLLIQALRNRSNGR